MENKEKLLALVGYSTKGGNTEKLLKDYLDLYGKDKLVDIVDLNTLDFKGCIHCKACLKKPRCKLEDDLSPIYEKVEAAEELVFASPVYFNGLSWLLKKFIDRMQVYFPHEMNWQEKKQASLLVTAGAPSYPRQFDASYLEAEITFKTLGYEKIRVVQVNNTDKEPYERGSLNEDVMKKNGIYRRKGRQWELIEE